MNISSWILSVIKLNISSSTIISWGHLKTLSLMSDSCNLELNLFAWKYTLELELNEQRKTEIFRLQTQKKKIHSKRMQWQCSFRLTNEKIKWLWGSKTIKSTIISNYVDLVIMKMSWIPRYARKKEMKLHCVSWLSFLLDIALFLHPQTGIVFMVYDSWYLFMTTQVMVCPDWWIDRSWCWSR